jgi:uncharacterized protein YndB with AHSA1/START domain
LRDLRYDSATGSCVSPKGEIEMLTDRIEREIRIDAPIDVVWSVVTEPEQITHWFSDSAEFELQPGAEGALTFRGSRQGSRPNDSQRNAVINLRVERAEPPCYLSFRWDVT